MSADGDGDAESHVRVVRPRWGRAALLVCGKCLKRHPDGKAMRRIVKAELEQGASKRRVRIIKTACVGLCPRRAIVLASAATLSTGEIVLVGDRGQIPGAVARLLPNRS